MQAAGGCYCGDVRYEVNGRALFKGECYCRACQHASGGGPNLFMSLPADAFCWSKGKPKTYSKEPGVKVSRHFCGTCGTQMVTTRPDMPGMVILKIGTLDDPALFGSAKVSIFTEERQPFHRISTDFPAFETLPPLG